MPYGASEYNELQAAWSGVQVGPGKSAVRSALRAVYLLITITLFAASHPHLMAQEGTTQATPTEILPDAPGAVKYPVAEVVPPAEDITKVLTEEDTLSRVGSVLILDGDVKVTYRDRVVTADHIEFNQETHELTANGHLHVTGGPNHEDITASHGTMNLTAQTARFYDVTGSVGMKNAGHSLTTYANSN